MTMLKSIRDSTIEMKSLFESSQPEIMKDGIAVLGLENDLISFRDLFNSTFRKDQVLNFTEEYHYSI